MTKIAEHIQKINHHNEKALSIFLTAGFPYKNNFTKLALDVLESGADLLELGIPFSDPLADGPVIQHSSQVALNNNTTIKDVLKFTEQIKSRKDNPVILMGYSNPILKYGINNFFNDAKQSGVDGIIVPDIPMEEYDSFFNGCTNELDIILLTTPTSSSERIKKIDDMSNGFVYCVSVTGTTGTSKNFNQDVIESLKNTYSQVHKNKLLIGFGISSTENIKQIKPFCDGVIIGSAVIKKLMDETYIDTLGFIKEMKDACRNLE